MSCLTLSPFSTQALKFKAPASSTRTDEQEHHTALSVGAVLYIFINISASPISSSSCNCPRFIYIRRIPLLLLPSSHLLGETRPAVGLPALRGAAAPPRLGRAVLTAPHPTEEDRGAARDLGSPAPPAPKLAGLEF